MATFQVSWTRDEDAQRWHKTYAVRYGDAPWETHTICGLTLEHPSADSVVAPPKDGERCDRCAVAQVRREERVIQPYRPLDSSDR